MHQLVAAGLWGLFLDIGRLLGWSSITAAAMPLEQTAVLSAPRDSAGAAPRNLLRPPATAAVSAS